MDERPENTPTCAPRVAARLRDVLRRTLCLRTLLSAVRSAYSANSGSLRNANSDVVLASMTCRIRSPGIELVACTRTPFIHENAVHPRMAGFPSLCTIITEEPHFSDVVRNMGNHTMQVPTAPPIPLQVTRNCSKNATPSFSAATALSSHNTCTSD